MRLTLGFNQFERNLADLMNAEEQLTQTYAISIVK